MRLRLLALLGFACFAFLPAAEPAPAANVAPAIKQPVLVAVHGAWAGGWHFKKIAPLLEAKGWKVYRPSLSGLGEHFNTARTDIGLATHIDDIVNLILFEDLHDVILLGHSYGGMVITGVADRIPERIGRLVYLDACLPVDGESLLTLHKPGATFDLDKMTRDGFVIPDWVKPGKPFPIDVPHPRKTFTDPIALKNQAAAAKIPATYILTVDKGKQPEEDDFYAASERARARGWPVIIMEADHNPQWHQPEALANLLLDLH
ncbi:alpha/beta fold hydrolase [Opitutus sp. GAS368]|uniref:alpha/beta fold hydrolase n=1 Tax=Opitutus sp. GAS368 TaxID=1882749 RepID=UPI00087D1962|nr:alpha/beta fold hydrolase [Opitutus sp. GAS368]SDR65359.1 Pimeloyl-ACP methyl ester carboxylesterase [Opitutus sp. GAS368]